MEASQGNQRRKAKEAQAQLSRSPSTSGGERRSPGEKRQAAGKACDVCVKTKVKCSLGNPCERCGAKGLPCTYEKNAGVVDGGLHSAQTINGYPSMVGQPGVGYGEGFNFPPPHPQAHMTQHGQHPVYARQTRLGPIQVSNGQEIHPRLKTSAGPSPQTSQYFGHPPPSEDWASFVHQQGGEPGFHEQSYYAPAEGMVPGAVDGTLPTTNNGIYSVLYEPAWRYDHHGAVSHYPWQPKPSPPQNPLQSRCHDFHDLLFSRRQNPAIPPPTERRPIENDSGDDLKAYITPQNVRDFVKLYFTNYHNHFPMLHIPTFDIGRASDCLVLAMFCVGAVYSECGINHDQVRRLMDFVYNALVNHINEKMAYQPNSIPSVEDMEAMMLLMVLFTWHGSYDQRRFVLRTYHNIVALARRARLFSPLTAAEIGPDNVSDYHQVRADNTQPPSKRWNWHTWIEQEKRNRAMLIVFLLDSALVIYFNVMPQVRTHDIHITLPCDDASWDAPDAASCSMALGLTADKDRAPGSAPRYPQQPEFLTALRVLMNPGLDLPFCCTNAQSKFILIHALHVQVYYYQRRSVDASSALVADWIRPTAPTEHNQDAYLQPNGLDVFRGNILAALECWRKAWETDLIAQFPDPSDRVGFIRDGMPYYWLAKQYMRVPTRQMVGFYGEGVDQNVGLVVKMLNHVRKISTDLPGRENSVKKEENATNGVNEIGAKDGPTVVETVTKMKSEPMKESYGVDDLMFDMKLLFRPVTTVVVIEEKKQQQETSRI